MSHGVPVVMNDDFYPKPPEWESKITKEFNEIFKSDGNKYRVQAGAAPSRISLNDVLKDQIMRIGEFTDVTEKEFGGLIMKDKDGVIIDFIQIGEDRSVIIRPTRPLREDEWILGSYHNHPITDKFSIPDINSFLANPWEEVMILRGAHKTFHVAIKTIHTRMGEEIAEEDQSSDNVFIAEKYGFALYSGIDADDLKLRNSNLDVADKTSSLDNIVKKLKGSKHTSVNVKKGKGSGIVNFDLKAMTDQQIDGLSEEEFEAGLRKKYNIGAKTPSHVFLYYKDGKGKFPVKSKQGGKWVLNKRLVRAALTRFHQTSPDVQSAIRGKLARLAKKFGFNPPGESKDKKEDTQLNPGGTKIEAMFDAAMKEISSAKKGYFG